MLFAVTFQHRQRGCSYHGDPVHVSVHACVCVSVPVCDWLMGQGGWAGGASESIFLPQTRTERQRDTDLLTALSFLPSSSSFSSSSSSSSSSPFSGLQLSLRLSSTPYCLSSILLTDRTTALTLGLLHLWHHLLQWKTDRDSLDPRPTGSPWQRSSVPVSPKSISCTRSWASKYNDNDLRHHHHL